MYLAYLYVIAIIFVIIGLIAGGVFTLILIPIAIIVAAGGLLAKRYGLGSKKSRRQDENIKRDADQRAAENRPPAGEQPETPDDLVDARRKLQ